MAEIEFREVSRADYGPLAEMIDEEWKFYIYSEARGRDMALNYLLHCMDGSNCARVLYVDGEPAGIVVVGGIEGATSDYSDELAHSTESLKADPSFDQFTEDMKAIARQYKLFVRDHKKGDWAELNLVIVSADRKGMGLGRRMMEEAKRFASGKGKTGLFFYTDTDCDFGFYDHIGAVRMAEGTVLCLGEPLRMFAYRVDF